MGVGVAICLAVALGIFFSIYVSHVGAERAALGFLIVSCYLLPVSVLGIGEQINHAGITSGRLTVTTYGLATLFCLLTFRRTRTPLLIWVPSILLACYLAIFSIWLWPSRGNIDAGILHMMIGSLALPAGFMVMSRICDDRDLRLSITRWLLFSALIQLPVMLGQLVGLDLFPTDALTMESEGYRPHGTLDHPGTLGKLALLALIFLIPLLKDADPAVARTSRLAIITFFPLVIITGSRANFLALALAVIVLGFISPGMSIARRLGPVLLIASLVAISAPWWLERFETGEDGSIRARLLEVGLQQLSNNPWRGVGVNNYIESLSTWAATAKNGWPVHNSFVYVAVELGLVGAGIFFGPLVVAVCRSFARFSTPGFRGDVCRVFIAIQPGLLFVLMTGWGMLALGSLTLLFLCLGAVLAVTRSQALEEGRRLLGQGHSYAIPGPAWQEK